MRSTVRPILTTWSIQALAARQTITVSTTPAVAARWLLPWVCLLRDSHPKLDLRIHAGHMPVPLDGMTAHAISAALDHQGVALMSKHLIADELQRGRLVQPFGPALEAHPFYFVYPQSRRDDPSIGAVREWVLTLPGGLCRSE